MPIASFTNGPLQCPTAEQDMEYIVRKISETLHLKACQKQLYYGCRSRSMPYSVVSPSQRKHVGRKQEHGYRFSKINNCLTTSCASGNHSSRSDNMNSDMKSPYDLLQELLREGTLVQEAVRRLQKRDETADSELTSRKTRSCTSPSSTCSISESEVRLDFEKNGEDLERDSFETQNELVTTEDQRIL